MTHLSWNAIEEYAAIQIEIILIGLSISSKMTIN